MVFQHHQRFGLPATNQGTHCRPAIALVAAHAKANFVLRQVRHQPGGGITAIEHQDIIGRQARQRLEQHLPLGHARAVDAGMQREFSAWQIQRKQALIRTGRAPPRQARTHRGHQHRRISRHHTQTMPARNQAQRIAVLHDKGVEPLIRYP